MNDIVTIITTVGFPIAMCLLMGWYIITINEKHSKEVDTLAEVINNNTVALEKLTANVEMLERKNAEDGKLIEFIKSWQGGNENE